MRDADNDTLDIIISTKDKSVIGKLFKIAWNTRPECLYAVYVLGHSMEIPTPKHLGAALRVENYLWNTRVSLFSSR